MPAADACRIPIQANTPELSRSPLPRCRTAPPPAHRSHLRLDCWQELKSGSVHGGEPGCIYIQIYRTHRQHAEGTRIPTQPQLSRPARPAQLSCGLNFGAAAKLTASLELKTNKVKQTNKQTSNRPLTCERLGAAACVDEGLQRAPATCKGAGDARPMSENRHKHRKLNQGPHAPLPRTVRLDTAQSGQHHPDCFRETAGIALCTSRWRTGASSNSWRPCTHQDMHRLSRRPLKMNSSSPPGRVIKQRRSK